MRIDIRAMHGAVAARAPAPTQREKIPVRFLPDVNFSSNALDLRVTLQAKVAVALDQHLRIHRTMRLMAGRTAVSQRLVLKGMRPGLFAVALRAPLIQSRHSQSSSGFHNVEPMRIVTLCAVHMPLGHWMVLRQIELRVRFQMTCEARCGIAAGIDDELAPSATDGRVPATRPVARFATRLARACHRSEMQSGVRAARKHPHIIGMALVTNPVPHEGRPLDFRGRQYSALHR
jgi:hypothetical protein